MLYILTINGKEKAYSLDKNIINKFFNDYKEETKYKFGVTVVENTDKVYRFLLGWEEHSVEARIIEKELDKRIM